MYIAKYKKYILFCDVGRVNIRMIIWYKMSDK